MRIAIDIDSTLHHYWDRLSEAAQRRFGVDLPYEEQHTWGVTRLKAEQLKCCIKETHTDAAILASEPYAGAVDAINRWHRAGHFIHVTSHREQACSKATAAWLAHIGLEYDELYCSTDKIARAREIEIDLLIDDNPDDLVRAVDAGMQAATILHPWNEDVVDDEGLVAAKDWATLAERLEAALPALREPARAA
jgi:uncharacterized protein